MLGVVPKTSTYAPTGYTLPYFLNIANLGAEAAMKQDFALMSELNTYRGHITYKATLCTYKYFDKISKNR